MTMFLAVLLVAPLLAAPLPLPPEDLEARASQGVVTVSVPTVTNQVALAGTHPPAVERWRYLVEDHFAPADHEWAMVVMGCESGGDPDAYNPSTASGLMQIKTFWLTEFPAHDSLFNPWDNIRIAALIHDTYGPTHWVCSP